MQGHFEGQQPSPYASISVNNPSRYTNSNLVNRRYMEQQAQQQQSQSTPVPIKPVIPRRRTANNSNNNNNNNSTTNEVISSQQQHQIIAASILNEQDILRSTSPSQSSHHVTTTTISQQDIKPNLNLPQFNSTPIVANNIPASANVEIATLFTMPYNQNFPNHSNH